MRALEKILGVQLAKRVQIYGALLHAGPSRRQALMNVLEMKSHTSENWNVN